MVEAGFEPMYKNPFGTKGQFGYEEAWVKNAVRVDLFSTVEKVTYIAWTLWVKKWFGRWGPKLEYPCVANRTSVENFSWGNVTIRAPVPFDLVLTGQYGDGWREPFPGQWVWNKHPFTVGACVRDRSLILGILNGR